MLFDPAARVRSKHTRLTCCHEAAGFYKNAMRTKVTMRKRGRHLNRFRKRHPTLGDSEPDSLYGYFIIPCDGVYLRVISSGEATGASGVECWEHVSVSLPSRCPTWSEMCFVKELFWGENETVLQFHPARKQYVNIHEFVLHLWKKDGTDHELPPRMAV